MHKLFLNGWGQDSVQPPGICADANIIDYSAFQNFEAFAAHAARHASPEILIGWSLGGLLAARLVAEGIWKPKRLVLIAAPFQFVADAHFAHAMPPDVFAVFRKNYVEDNMRTVARFNHLIVKGDAQAEMILPVLQNADAGNIPRWLPWLDYLGSNSAATLDFNNFPKTLLIQGREDAIVSFQHAEAYKKVITDAKLVMMEQASHAPHLRDTIDMTKQIQLFLDNAT